MFIEGFPASREQHKFTENGAICTICGMSWKTQPKEIGHCAGVPTYRKWDEIPEGLQTQNNLKKLHQKKLQVGQLSVAAKYDMGMHRFIPLYSISEARDIEARSDAQQEVLRRAGEKRRKKP
jgi:hypothetical protein